MFGVTRPDHTQKRRASHLKLQSLNGSCGWCILAMQCNATHRHMVQASTVQTRSLVGRHSTGHQPILVLHSSVHGCVHVCRCQAPFWPTFICVVFLCNFICPPMTYPHDHIYKDPPPPLLLATFSFDPVFWNQAAPITGLFKISIQNVAIEIVVS